MHDDPMKFMLPCMGGMIEIEVRGVTVSVKGALRVIVEMPLSLKYKRAMFTNQPGDAPTEALIVDTCCESHHALSVIVGKKTPDGVTISDSPSFHVAALEGQQFSLITRALHPFGDEPRRGEVLLQNIKFEPPHQEAK